MMELANVQSSLSVGHTIKERNGDDAVLLPFFLLSFMADQQIQCRDCGAMFDFSEGEQAFYAERNLSAPQRCKACRDARKSQRGGGMGGDRQMFDATCAQCGSACQVPFKPRPESEGGRPVLCKACFMASKA